MICKMDRPVVVGSRILVYHMLKYYFLGNHHGGETSVI